VLRSWPQGIRALRGHPGQEVATVFVVCTCMPKDCILISTGISSNKLKFKGKAIASLNFSLSENVLSKIRNSGLKMSHFQGI